MAAPSKSSTASIPEPTSASACPCCQPPIPHGPQRMRHKLSILLGIATVAWAIGGCGAMPSTRAKEPALPSVDRNATEATVIAGYLDICLRMARGTPAEQAEILAVANNDYNAAPTPSRVLRYAMLLST